MQQAGPPVGPRRTFRRAFAGQRQDGGARAPFNHLADRLGGAAIDPQRRQRAEMLARGRREASVHRGVADSDEHALLLGDGGGEHLPPDADDGLARQRALMPRQQAADDLGLAPRAQRAAAFFRDRHPLHDRGALHQQVVDAVIQPVQLLPEGGQAIRVGKGSVIRAGSGFG